jgi:hypothetical protein
LHSFHFAPYWSATDLTSQSHVKQHVAVERVLKFRELLHPSDIATAVTLCISQNIARRRSAQLLMSQIFLIVKKRQLGVLTSRATKFLLELG